MTMGQEQYFISNYQNSRYDSRLKNRGHLGQQIVSLLLALLLVLPIVDCHDSEQPGYHQSSVSGFLWVHSHESDHTHDSRHHHHHHEEHSHGGHSGHFHGEQYQHFLKKSFHQKAGVHSHRAQHSHHFHFPGSLNPMVEGETLPIEDLVLCFTNRSSFPDSRKACSFEQDFSTLSNPIPSRFQTYIFRLSHLPPPFRA